MAQRQVLVNGVGVPMYWKDPKDERSIVPLRIALGLLREHPSESFGGAPKDQALAAIDALQEAGVKTLPLYEEEARNAGIKWEEEDGGRLPAEA